MPRPPPFTRVREIDFLPVLLLDSNVHTRLPRTIDFSGVYSEAQKELILDEFRRKYPDDHFDKRLLLQFLRERQQDRV